MELNIEKPDVVCFVCTANMARSAMAESIFRCLGGGIETLSCGTHTVSGLPITDNSKIVLNEKGYDCRGHFSTSYQDLDLKKSLILCMTRSQKAFLKSQYLNQEIFLITELGSGESQDIEDPVKGDLKKYREVLEKLEYEIKLLISRFN